MPQRIIQEHEKSLQRDQNEMPRKIIILVSLQRMKWNRLSRKEERKVKFSKSRSEFLLDMYNEGEGSGKKKIQQVL